MKNLDCDFTNRSEPMWEIYESNDADQLRMEYNRNQSSSLIKINNLKKKSQTGICHRFVKFINSVEFLLYVACLISSWDDRGWSFAIGVFLIALYPDTLTLTAAYGFLSSGAVLLMGAIIGDWVDKVSRLIAFRVGIIARNVCTSICAVILCLTFSYIDYLHKPDNQALFFAAIATIVLFAILSHLGGIANNITINRDWAVVVSAGDNNKLADLTSMFRRINLSCKIVSPVVVGQIMSLGSKFIAAAFISAETLITLLILYFVLSRVYNRVPALALKETHSQIKKRLLREKKQNNKELTFDDRKDSIDIISDDVEKSDIHCVFSESCDDDQEYYNKQQPKRKLHHVKRMCGMCISLYRGWRSYMKYDVKYAGFGLALLFLTVLGFDNITVGYAYSQGMSESVLSIIMALAGVTGIFGTILFPIMRRKLSLVTTGLISYGLQLICLVMCLVSVFVPGSPFDLFANNSTAPVVTNETSSMNTSNLLNSSTTVQPDVKSSYLFVYPSIAPQSMALLMLGIVTSRVGLWLVDLSIYQLLLEEVPEKERGKVNGVQESLNMFLDLLKFGLVLILPLPSQFGLLIIISFSCIALGQFFYAGYVCKRKADQNDDLTATDQNT